MGTVRSFHLKQWAGTVDARNRLGELIRLLIHAGLPIENIRRIQFLANEANQLTGWDGVLDCSARGPWVPDGQSLWELGSGISDRAKVKSDFLKRDKDTKLPDGWTKQDTTYVAVSLGKFNDRVSLEKELAKGKKWKDVRVIDSAVFEEWIENYLAVEAWLQEQGVGAPGGTVSLRRFWRDWSEATHPPVSEELLLCNRGDAVPRLLSFLEEDNCVVRVKSDSQEESISFLFAAIESLNSDKSKNLLSKSIVINNSKDAGAIAHLPSHVVCLQGEAAGRANELSRNGHKVICPLGRSTRATKVDIELPRAMRAEFSGVLEQMGVEATSAETGARACGSSASIWRVWNQLDRGGTDHDLPEWAGQEHAEIVIPAVLSGGWDESNEDDKNQIELIAGMTYDEYRDKLQKYLTCDNSLLQKIGNIWVVSAPATAFAITIHGITTSHLERFRASIHAVFNEVDPTIDLPPADRMYAGIKSQELTHSTWIRDGLAESLLRVAVLGSRLEEHSVFPDSQSRQEYVDAAITELIGLSEDWRLITSIRSQLPVLAEAAPTPFLKALDRLLQGYPDSIAPIFEEGDALSGYYLHTEVLWALETLAWEPEYLPRVSLILAQMAQVDPGGSLSNRPINSLKEIFIAWHPSTSASLEERLSVVKLIMKKAPDVGWDLVLALMPSGSGVSHETNKPIWREFSRSDRPVLTRGEVWRAYKEFFQLALEVAEGAATRLAALLDSYENVAEEEQDALRDAIARLLGMNVPPEDKKLMWESLRKIIARHSSFPNAAWSLPTSKIQDLLALQEDFYPEDSIDKNVWLFDDHLPDLPKPSDDYRKTESEVNDLRLAAIAEIVAEHGQSGLIELGKRAGLPGVVGFMIPEIIADVDDVLQIVVATIDGDNDEQVFSQAVSGRMYAKHGVVWRDRVLERVKEGCADNDVLVRPFLQFRIDEELMDFLSDLGPEFERAFWMRASVWNIEKNKESLSRGVKCFVAIGRAMEVLMVIAHELDELDNELAFEVLEAILTESAAGKKLGNYGNTAYYIEQIFENLARADDGSLERLAKLEYAYLPLLHLRHGRSSLVLHRYLATDPKFFVSVLCDLYKPEGANEAKELTDESSSRATRAWEMLHCWEHPPGLQEDGSVDEEFLRRWVTAARKAAKQEDRVTMAEQHIGHVLYHLPTDPTDGQWPTASVRDAVEEILSEEVSRGFQTEQFNARGVTSRAMFEGGSQERQLEEHWRKNAIMLESEWPKIGQLCRETSESWAWEAAREDERAAKDRLKYQ